MQTTYDSTLTEPRAARGPVASLALCVAVLIASEFMPVSLLTPIADGLHLTEGRAGQAISVSGIFAVLTSVFISALARMSLRSASPPFRCWRRWRSCRRTAMPTCRRR